MPADSTSNSKNRKDPMKTTANSWFVSRPDGVLVYPPCRLELHRSPLGAPLGWPGSNSGDGPNGGYRYPADWSKAKRRQQRKKDMAAKLAPASCPGKQRGSAKSRKKGPNRFLGDPSNDPKVKKRKLHQCQSKLAEQWQWKRKKIHGNRR